MTEITRATNRGWSVNTIQKCEQIPGLTAGEDLHKMDVCRIDPNDGKVYRATSGCATNQSYTSGSTTANLSASDYIGFAPYEYKSGEVVTVLRGGAAGDYGSGLTPGRSLWIGQTSGSLSSASAINNLDRPVAVCVSSTKILVI
jgi:hypothetical protein